MADKMGGNNMRKKGLKALALVTAFSLMLTGCGKKDEKEDKTTVTGGSSSDQSESGKTGGSYEQPTVSAKKACDGESYGAGSDWAKYDINNDGCINDIEFQNGMNDAIEKRTGGSSYSSDKTDRTGLCEFKQNGVYVCNKKAMNGYSFCQEHWDMMYAGYEAFKDTYDQVTGNR
jgi:hypothetical protein